MYRFSLFCLIAVVAIASAAQRYPTAPSYHRPTPSYRPAPSYSRPAPHYRPRPAPYRAPTYKKPTPAPYRAPTYRRRNPAPYRAATYRPAPYSRPSHAPGARVIDDCTCFEKGNYYSPVSSNDCRSFTQRTAFLPAQIQNCPYGLQFDVKTCVCNFPKDTRCPSYCPRGYAAPATTSYATCSQSGNIYAQVPRTHCKKFTQATNALPPQVHSCPYGLQFDMKTCVCNHPKDTVCRV